MVKYSKKNIRLTLIFILICGVIFYIFFENIGTYLKFIHEHFQIKRWILSFGKWDFIAFIILQVLQVVLMFVPGEVVQAAGGYIFGTFWGTILALCGILVGSIATFFIGRLLGEHVIRRILPKRELTSIEGLINTPKNKIVLTVLYLIPGLPKDILGYISGITSIKFKSFAVISTVTRIPGVLASTYLGSKLYHGNYLILTIGMIFILAILIVGVSQRDKILSYIK